MRQLGLENRVSGLTLCGGGELNLGLGWISFDLGSRVLVRVSGRGLCHLEQYLWIELV